MPDNDFWIGQEQIPVDLSLLLTYYNDEDYWYAPGEYALRVYTVDTLNTNFARPCFALGERKFEPEAPAASLASEARDAKAARTELDSQSEIKDAPTRSEKADGSL